MISGLSNKVLIAIASIRLTEAGLEFPKHHLIPEPKLTLYDRLQKERDDAYYNTLLDNLTGFGNALELTTPLNTDCLD